MSSSNQARVAAVIVTHRRAEQLRASLNVVCRQTLPPEWVIVVDNAAEPEVADLVTEIAGERGVYLPSKRNLGGAGGFALGMLHALALGAEWIWCADDDGRPEDEDVLATLYACAQRYGLAEVSPVVCSLEDPERLAFPLRRGLRWRRTRAELWADDADPRPRRVVGPDGAVRYTGFADQGAATGATLPDDYTVLPEDGGEDLLPGIASLFNGALLRASTLERIGVPDYRLFIRGDEVEFHRRLARSGLPFGTCLTTAYLHPYGADEFRPILGGIMHTQYPDNETKRFFTYRNRGYLMNQPGMRKLLPQEYARFGWFFLVQRRDPAGFATWLKLQRMGRDEDFSRPE